MAGDITQPKRPRYESNERFDTVDANAASQAPRDHIDAATRSLLSTPRTTVSTPTGLIITGFTLTPNPTAGNDALVRINAEVGVALDANGRTIIKPNGVTFDVTIPIGTFQIYIYYVEDAVDNAKRRFLPAAPPFVEFTKAIETAFQGTFNVFLRPGGLPLAVGEDVVNGATTPLCLVGIATNGGAGAIAITGWNAVTAPNGTDIINRLSNVNAPTSLPTRYSNGVPQTIHDLMATHAYMRGRAEFLGGRTTLTAYATASSAVGVLSWTEAGASWVPNELVGCVLKDAAIPNKFWLIASNTATVLTLSGFFRPGFSINASGTPTGGAGTIYGPIAGNNFGAFTEPSRSLQQMNDLWSNFFNGFGDLVMPPVTIILLDDTTGLITQGDGYVHQPGTLYIGRQISPLFGTYVPTPGTRRAVVKMCGGGAGGGGVAASGGAAFFGAAGGGGSSGVYFEKNFYFGGADITGGAAAVGAGGAGGVGGSAGSVGGDTTITIQATVYTAKGGGGGHKGVHAGDGAFATGTAFIQFAHGGIPQAGSSAGDFIKADHGGTGCAPGTILTSPALGGSGGGGMSGIGGRGGDFNENGVDGSGNGAGGGGASSYPAGAQPAFNGGAGTEGLIIIDEYR